MAIARNASIFIRASCEHTLKDCRLHDSQRVSSKCNLNSARILGLSTDSSRAAHGLTDSELSRPHRRPRLEMSPDSFVNYLPDRSHAEGGKLGAATQRARHRDHAAPNLLAGAIYLDLLLEILVLLARNQADAPNAARCSSALRELFTIR